MLKELERYFNSLGWYAGTHDFMEIKLEGGFEAFSGRASETWEYRWVINIPANDKLKMPIPEITVKGRRFESLDDVAKTVINKLGINDEPCKP